MIGTNSCIAMELINRELITIYTDGSCTTKGRKCGGFGVYLTAGESYVTLRRGYWNTTTTRMEMMAVFEALCMIDPDVPTNVKIISDSQFVVNAFKCGWLQQWRMNGWQGVKNPELWNKILKTIASRPKMKFQIVWTPGHQTGLGDTTVFGNNIADALANFKTQDSWEQDLDLNGYSWYYHESSDYVFIEKSDKYEELNSMGDIYELGPCNRANDEELLERVNGTHLFESFLEGKLNVNFEVEEII